MKVVFHEKYYNSEYAWDPAASPGRLDGIIKIILDNKNKDQLEIITPRPATEEEILRAHGKRHYQHIKNRPLLYELAKFIALFHHL